MTMLIMLMTLMTTETTRCTLSRRTITPTTINLPTNLPTYLPINLPTYLKMRSIHVIYWGYDGNCVWCCVWCGCWCVVVGVW